MVIKEKNYIIILWTVFQQYLTLFGMEDSLYFGSCGKSEVPSGRENQIDGRWQGKQGEFPWVVSFKWQSQSYCEGVIINSIWVLTAAHCFDTVEFGAIHLVIGEHDITVVESSEQIRRVAKYVPHEGYNADTNENDIALLKLDAPIKFDRFAQPICLPNVDIVFANVSSCTYSGWGVSNTDHILGRDIKGRPLRMLPLDTCQNEYKETFSVVDQQHICAEFENASTSPCLGDSGGPLTCTLNGPIQQEILFGVTSMGPEDCGDSPVVYIKVMHYLEWIKNTIAQIIIR